MIASLRIAEEGKRITQRSRVRRRIGGTLREGGSWLTITPPTPMSFINADSKDS
jgi:hypothetical protein